MNRVFFNYSDRQLRLNSKKELRCFVEQLFEVEKVELNKLDYIFCSDTYLHNINKEFLGHDNYTDIITFYFSKLKEPVIGEIYISLDRVRENAKKFNVSYNHEVLRVLFHGALHLCGYKDKTKKDRITMKAKEDFYLSKFVSRETAKQF